MVDDIDEAIFSGIYRCFYVFKMISTIGEQGELIGHEKRSHEVVVVTYEKQTHTTKPFSKKDSDKIDVKVEDV